MAQQARQQLAEHIARLMREQGIADFQQAKRKAVRQLEPIQTALPSNTEIASAIQVQEQLFSAQTGNQRDKLLGHALELMRHFADFQPRLSGRVAAGLVTDHSWLQLHLFCETPEEVDLFLQERGIDYRTEDKRLRFHDGHANQPAFVFDYAGTDVLVVVFEPRQRSRKPLSPIDGKPMPRLSPRQIEALLRGRDQS